MTEDALYELRRRIGMVFQNPDNQLVATIVEEMCLWTGESRDF